MAPRKRLGEMLIEAGIIGETQLKAALGHQRKWGVRIGQALVDLKLATEGDIVRALASKYGFDIARLGAVDQRALQQTVPLLPREFAVRHNVLPIATDQATITVVMSDPSNLAVVDEVQFRTGKRVKVCVGGDREVAEAVARNYPGDGSVEAIALDLDLDVDDAGGEAVFDPFGGGSKDALDAFFGGGPEPLAHDAGASRARAKPAQQGPVTGARAEAQPAPAAARRAAPAVQPGPAPAPPRGAPAPKAPEQAPAAWKPPSAPPRPGSQGAGARGRELTEREIAILDALERLADGAYAEPEIVKPAQAMAAVIRLLLRKHVVTEVELLDELGKK